MSLPPLYLEGLKQSAVRGRARLDAYKLGIVEAVLKQARGAGGDEAALVMRRAVETALEVVRWEPRPDPPPEPDPFFDELLG